MANSMEGLKKATGLGDMVKTMTSKMGIKPCSACEKRAEKLNKMGRRMGMK